jgi:phosphoglycolate phosphatase-like HAD superfamily hydrolase
MASEPKSVVLGLRLSPEQKAELEAMVREMNDQAYEQGRAPVYTVANVLQGWAVAGLEAYKASKSRTAPVATDSALRPAPNVLAALEKLRGAGK